MKIKTAQKINHSNCLPNKTYNAKKVSGGFVVKSRRFGLFIDERDAITNE